MSAIYDSLARRYDRLHARWLAWAGGEAQAALEAAVLSRLEPGMSVLDAGCGTGRLARHLAHAAPASVRVTLIDSSVEMLRFCRDLPYRAECADLTDLPYDDASFDIVVAAWSVEATPDPDRAISELFRVLRPWGYLVVAFCSTNPTKRIAGRLLRHGVERRGAGRFLDPERVIAQARLSGADAVIRHRVEGPASTISLRKGKEVSDCALAA